MYFRKASKVFHLLMALHGSWTWRLLCGDLKVEGLFGGNLSFFTYFYLGWNKILFGYVKIYLINFQWEKNIHDNYWILITAPRILETRNLRHHSVPAANFTYKKLTTSLVKCGGNFCLELKVKLDDFWGSI